MCRACAGIRKASGAAPSAFLVPVRRLLLRRLVRQAVEEDRKEHCGGIGRRQRLREAQPRRARRALGAMPVVLAVVGTADVVPERGREGELGVEFRPAQLAREALNVDVHALLWRTPCREEPRALPWTPSRTNHSEGTRGARAAQAAASARVRAAGSAFGQAAALSSVTVIFPW